MVGQRIGQYRITRELGRGGMGVVYEAVHERIGQHAAVKTLTEARVGDPGARERFFREARACVLIDHEGVPAVFDFGETDDGTPYILMELLRGDSLRARVRKHAPGGLPVTASLRIARQLGSALCAAHARGISHRDLKPDNVVLVPDTDAPGGERAKILDFGIASLRDEGGEPPPGGARVLGTPAYMAPEQCVGQAESDAETGRSDVYALGVLLYELLCGEPPFTGESDEILRRQIFETPVPPRERLPTLPEPVDALVLRMLCKTAAERPAMPAVVQALDAALGERAPGPVPVPVAVPGPVPSPGPGLGPGLASPPAALVLRGVATVDDAAPPARYQTDESYGETVRAVASRGASPGARAVPAALSGGASADPRAASDPARRRWRIAAAAGAAAALVLAAAALLPGARPGSPAAAATVRLPGGTFTMGSTAEEIDAAFYFCQRQERDEDCRRALFEREQPLRTITLSPFSIDATEVTNERFAQWLSGQADLRMVYDEARHTRWIFAGDVPLVNLYPTFPTYGLRREPDGRFQPVPGYAARPVTQVTWLAAARYCAAHGQRLPTEAEWEYAARPRPGDRYPWGSSPPRCEGVVFGRLRDQECAGRGAEPAPVASSAQDRTPQGIHDLAGNVAEWVQDRFGERYPACAEPCVDPVVADEPGGGPVTRVFRGGDWAQVAAILRSAGRGRWRQDEALQNVGFRCVSPG